MNDLSWLIYAADVAGSGKGVAAAALGASALTAAGAYLSRAFNGDMARIFNRDEHIAKRDAANRFFKPCAAVASVAAIFLIIVPSRDTIYAIAASEMGEEVIESETFNRATRALDAWLDRQIGDEQESAQ